MIYKEVLNLYPTTITENSVNPYCLCKRINKTTTHNTHAAKYSRIIFIILQIRSKNKYKKPKIRTPKLLFIVRSMALLLYIYN